VSETTGDVLATVNSTLAGKELMDLPRAFLLLRLCQLWLIFSREKAEHYWSQLAPLEKKISKDLKTDFESLRSIMEATSSSGAKGFAAELIADVEAAKRLPPSDTEEAKRRLHNCKDRLEKRRWPTGKTPVRIALVEAWAGIDRQYALQMVDTIPGNARESLIIRINRVKPLTANEWMIVVDKADMKQAVQIALKILDEEKAQLLPPGEVLLEVVKWIRDSMRSSATSQRGAELLKEFIRYTKLVKLQSGGDQADVIPTLLEEMYVFLAEDRSLDRIWSERFSLITGLLELGVSSGSLTREIFEGILKRTPSYLVNFVRAHYAAVSASPSDVEDAYMAVLSETGQDRDVEAWFLAALVRRGLGLEAMGLAEKSDRAGELLPRLRRAWLCTHPESAKSVISAADMAGDPIGEFLAQGAVQDRVSYLRKTTYGGTRSVPGALWAGPGTEEEPEGLRGLLKRITSTKKSLDEISTEYVALTPLYASYRGDTKKEEQFREQLRIAGYGEYKYQDVDGASLETLVAWGDQDPTQVRSVLRAMWAAIQPNDQILQIDWLRNAILTRCRNVLAADPETLIQDFLGWLKKELVEKGRYWQIGNMQYTLKLPETTPLMFCVFSAMTISHLSPTRRDEILLSGLRTFKADSPAVQAVAQLHNRDKEVLDLHPPVELKKNLVEAWQLGVAMNAIPHIITAMAAQVRERLMAEMK